jgi:hypothetical protein
MIQLNCGSTWHPSLGQQHGEAALRPEHIGLCPTPGTHALVAHDDDDDASDFAFDVVDWGSALDSDVDDEGLLFEVDDAVLDADDESAPAAAAAAHVFAVGTPVGHFHSCPAAASASYVGAQSLVRVMSQPSGMPECRCQMRE